MAEEKSTIELIRELADQAHEYAKKRRDEHKKTVEKLEEPMDEEWPTASKARKKQGPGFWMGDIGEE